jgi:predicted site-specific integrase-resolvase
MKATKAGRPATHYTTTEAAQILDVSTSKLKRMFLDGILPEPARLGRNRVLTAEDVNSIKAQIAGTKSCA